MAKTNTNPEVRFAGFSEDWVPSKLGNIGEVKMCKRIFNNQTSPKGDIPFYKIGTFGKKADSYISKELYQEFRNKYPFPKEGDILISASGTLGRIVVYDGKPAYFQDSNIVWLNHDESKILNEFLYYIYGNITYESEGGTIQRLYNSIILNARFSFPESKDEQKLIGNFFENIDNLITEHQHKHSKLKSLKQAMLDKMFPKQGQLVPEIRFKGFEGDWEEHEVGKIFKVTRGNVLAASKLSKTKSDVMKYPVYSSQTTNNGLLGYYDDYLFEDAITWTTDGANAGTVNFRKGKFYSTNVNGVLLSDEGFANTMVAEAINKLSDKYVSRVGNPKLMNNVMSQIKIVIPNSIDEQNLISRELELMDNVKSQHEMQITKLQNIKKAFLSKMFI